MSEFVPEMANWPASSPWDRMTKGTRRTWIVLRCKRVWGAVQKARQRCESYIRMLFTWDRNTWRQRCGRNKQLVERTRRRARGHAGEDGWGRPRMCTSRPVTTVRLDDYGIEQLASKYLEWFRKEWQRMHIQELADAGPGRGRCGMYQAGFGTN